ncbi:MAG: hypothetical protein QNK16_11255 [Woeseiaceae bacterium]|nr:hypothetical protein [Woeseiaceae bacterium]MDX2608952.1 hypothetical protein [Woeseiaceae bacterium]
MSIRNRNRSLTMLLFGFGILVAGGCSSPSDNDGEVINGIALPSDVVLNLACENVGIYPENCVLGDPENPFITTTIIEFDSNNPRQDDKFDLNDTLPPGPAGAKARFYLWATALARRPSGENQYYTARALHELFNANSNVLSTDELAREQALKAYKSVLDNFWGSVTFFECELCAPDEFGDLIKFPAQLNEEVGDDLFRFDSTGFKLLVEGGDIRVLELIGKWGYTYDPAIPEMSKNEF